MYIVLNSKKAVILIICLVVFFSCGYLGNRIKNSTVNTIPDIVPTKLIIDAGHGGFDGGAVSDSGIIEKDINLDIALKLADLLKSEKIEVILTRDGDFALNDANASLKKASDTRNRLKIIDDNYDAVFISIHMNKFPQKKYSGAQVFYSKNNEKSEKLAALIQKNIKADIQIGNNRQIKQAGSDIFLLKNATIPAILVECGFLSNDDEAILLSTEEYRAKIAECLNKSILYFFEYERYL